MNTIVKAVRQTLEEAGLLRRDARLLCAVSGGGDSVALLHALSRLQKETAFALVAVHVQHGLRGKASQMDEQFVRTLCAQLDVPLQVESAGLSGSMEDAGMETLARDSRRRIFARLMQQESMDAILLAHHRDDQTETVLMHLLRGAGGAGLSGMQLSAPFAGGLVLRPLLNLPKQAIRSALAGANLPCCEDESNAQPVTPRNILRLTHLPQLETLFPGAGAHIAHAAESLSADEAYLNRQADALYEQAVYCTAPVFALRRRVLAQAPEALVRRMLRRWYADALDRAGLAPGERVLSYEDTLLLMHLTKAPAGTAVNLPCGLKAEIQREWLHLLYQSGEPLCKTHGSGWRIVQAPASAIPASPMQAVLSPQIQALHPVLRTPQPGDVIRPMGAPGEKPLRRFLTDRKTDPYFRPVIPVLAAGQNILWVPGLAAAEELRLEEVPEGSILLSLEGECAFLENHKE